MLLTKGRLSWHNLTLWTDNLNKCCKCLSNITSHSYIILHCIWNISWHMSNCLTICSPSQYLQMHHAAVSDFYEHLEHCTPHPPLCLAAGISIINPLPGSISLHTQRVTPPLQRIRTLHWACSLQMQPVDGAKWRGGERGGERTAEREPQELHTALGCCWRAAWEDLSLTAQMECERGIQMTGMSDCCHQRGKDMW